MMIIMLFKELRQHCFSERPQASSTGTYDQSNFNKKISMKRWWYGSDTRKHMYPEKNISLCQLVQDKPNIDRPGIEPEPPIWKSGD